MARICIFGDSISFGVYDPANGGWSSLLKRAWLKQSQFNQVYDLSISGINSHSVLERIGSEAEERLDSNQKDKNSIIIAIGQNDSKLIDNKTPFVPQDIFKRNINETLELSKNFAENLYVLGLTPVDESKTNPISWNKNEFYNNLRVEEYNGILCTVTSKTNAVFIDIFEEWTRLEYNDLLYDGLHPNSEGHEKIYEQIMKAAGISK